MLRLVAILLVGFGIFVGANGWQTSQWDSYLREVPNFFGQVCKSGICFRPEWLAVGLVIVLIGTWMFLSNRQPLDVSGDTRKLTAFARRRWRTLLSGAVAATVFLSLGGFIRIGSVTAAASYAWCGLADVGYPVSVTLRNDTPSVVRRTMVQVAIRESDGTVYPYTVTVDRLLLPFQQDSWCVRTDYTDAVIRPSDNSSSGPMGRLNALMDRSQVTAKVMSFGWL